MEAALSLTFRKTQRLSVLKTTRRENEQSNIDVYRVTQVHKPRPSPLIRYQQVLGPPKTQYRRHNQSLPPPHSISQVYLCMIVADVASRLPTSNSDRFDGSG